jgi:triphosphoribosyl-dephospho-CoA synthetase
MAAMGLIGDSGRFAEDRGRMKARETPRENLKFYRALRLSVQ